MTRIITTLLLIVLTTGLGAQSPIIERIIIDTFYIASAKDTGIFEDGFVQSLPEESITYRIFVDLPEGVKLLSVFGDQEHPLRIKSSEPFFNNTDRGEDLATKIRGNKLNENSLMLDSWLTIGFASDRHMGILKNEDIDGAIPEIANNTEGLLHNTSSQMGLSLQQADGLINANEYVKSGIAEFGITQLYDAKGNYIEDRESVFGNKILGNVYTGYKTQIKYLGGMLGATSSNTILIAQLTTKGQLSFMINIQVELPNGQTATLYGTDTLLGLDGKYNPWLQYPFNLNRLYGCTDPDFVEYSPDAIYDNETCTTRVVFGCMDSAACNFSPLANAHKEELCCYDSKCALDLNIICPGIVYGCMDSMAVNFNPLANTSSQTDACIYCNNIGCMDEAYAEYSTAVCYNDSTACKTLVIKGCTDKKACNYNPVANAENNAECVYECLEHEPAIPQKKHSAFQTDITIYPLPATGIFYYAINAEKQVTIPISISDINGNVIHEENIQNTSGKHIGKHDLSNCKKGMYIFSYTIDNEELSQIIVLE